MIAIRTATLLLLMSAATALAASPADDAWIAAIEGGWAGQADRTPMGEMPFVMLFDRGPDGSLESSTALNRETYITLRFWRGDDGRWLLTESAGLEGQGQQEYTLEPVASDGDARRWVVAERPDFMTIDVALAGTTLSLDVDILGRPHASFELERLDDARLPELRAALGRQARLDPADNSIWDVVNEREPAPDPVEVDPIGTARALVAAHPDDAKLHMALARELSQAIQSDPAAGPRYAFELLQTLQTTVRLDPTLVDAYTYLVGYYMNAPAIAGGSLQKAEETALQLAQYDPATSEALLEQIARRRDSDERAAGH